jgi:hypothetical protein
MPPEAASNLPADSPAVGARKAKGSSTALCSLALPSVEARSSSRDRCLRELPRDGGPSRCSRRGRRDEKAQAREALSPVEVVPLTGKERHGRDVRKLGVVLADKWLPAHDRLKG